MKTEVKRKEVSLGFETIALLKLQAKKEGRNLKNYMEYILIQQANDFEVTDEYKKEMDALLAKHKKGQNKYVSKKKILTSLK